MMVTANKATVDVIMPPANQKCVPITYIRVRICVYIYIRRFLSRRLFLVHSIHPFHPHLNPPQI